MWWRAVTSNLHWKALSLLIAIVLWFVVVGEPELVTSHSAPIFFKNLPRSLEIGSDVPDRVHLEIRGPAGKLTPAALADTAVLLDLGDVAPGERTFTVANSSTTLPAGVVFLRAIPSQLRLHFDRVTSKDVPVQIRTSGQPPAGYRVVGEVADPGRLHIAGAEGRVQQTESAQTDPIDLSSLVGKAEFRVHAYVSDPQVRFETTPIVKVTIMVEKN